MDFFKNLFFYSATVKSKKTGKMITKRYMSGWLIFVISALLAFGTWNPSHISFFEYAKHLDFMHDGFAWMQAFFVFLLWVLGFVALKNAVTKWGILAMILLSAFFIWGAVERNWFEISDWDTMGWIIDAILAIFIWFGAMASRFWYILTGQMVVENTGSDSDDSHHDID